MKGYHPQSPNPRAAHDSGERSMVADECTLFTARTGAPGLGVSQPQHLFCESSLPLDDQLWPRLSATHESLLTISNLPARAKQPIPHEGPAPMSRRYAPDILLILSDSECLSLACNRLRSGVNDLDLTHQFDVDGPIPDQVREHTTEETRTISGISATSISLLR